MSNQTSDNNKRIAKNTILLYFRMIFMMAVQLYTSRVVLNTLGVEDYGIYNVVGGVVAMFSFLNNAMTASTQRYITFELGKGNANRLKQIFSTSVNIHVLISILVVILGETIGLWFLNHKLVIPEGRITAAFIVYQASILTTVFAIMSYPFNADIVAHEKMSAFAYISILEASLKLAVVFLLVLGNFDKLILYAYLIVAVQLCICLCYILYCRCNFTESRYHFCLDKPLFKEMLNFAGWNLWGNLAAILMTQGVNLLLNMFFGPAVNAARAVSVQVQSAINQFSSNFQMALNPQITKTYASGKLGEMHKLIYRSSKFTFFLLFTLCLPVFFEAPFILKIWLKIVPDYTVIFLRFMILILLIDSTANPLMVSASATGKVKVYQSVIGGMLLLILPFSYIALKLGGQPWIVFAVHLSICIIAFITRLFIIRPLINLNLRDFVKQVIFRCSFVSVVSLIVPAVVYILLDDNYFCFILVVCASILSSSIMSFYLGLDAHERYVVVQKIQTYSNKFKRSKV